MHKVSHTSISTFIKSRLNILLCEIVQQYITAVLTLVSCTVVDYQHIIHRRFDPDGIMTHVYMMWDCIATILCTSVVIRSVRNAAHYEYIPTIYYVEQSSTSTYIHDTCSKTRCALVAAYDLRRQHELGSEFKVCKNINMQCTTRTQTTSKTFF